MDYHTEAVSENFLGRLRSLNSLLSESLKTHGLEQVLIGNLFYDHLELNFQNNPPNTILEGKRIRLFDLARKCSNVFEVGVNGGHSAFLMLHANPQLKYTGNDIAKYYPAEPRCHPEVYVPTAFEFLKSAFPDRVQTITGDCLVELPKYASENNTPHIDLLHLDGHKATYERDFVTMRPLLKKGAYVVFDDTQQEAVQQLVDKLLQEGIVTRCEYPKMESSEIFTHEIVRLV